MVDTRVWDSPGLGNSCNILEVVSNMASICNSCPYKCIFIFKTLNFKATFLIYVVLWDFVSILPTRNIDRKLYFSKNAWLKITRDFLDSFSWNPALWERTQSSKIKGHRRNFEIARNFTRPIGLDRYFVNIVFYLMNQGFSLNFLRTARVLKHLGWSRIVNLEEKIKEKNRSKIETSTNCKNLPQCFHLKASTAKANAMKIKIFLIAILIVFSLGKQDVLISQNLTSYL